MTLLNGVPFVDAPFKGIAMEIITGLQNEGVKRMRALKRRSERRESGLHLIEGERLVFDAIASNAELVSVYVLASRHDLAGRLAARGIRFTFVSDAVIRSISDTDTPQGICASVRTPDQTPPIEYPSGLVVALDALQDPGNLGTIIRTADAFGAAGILLGEGSTDAFSPKSLRAAMGSTYHIPIFSGELEEEVPKLKASGFTAVCGHLKGSETLPTLGRDRLLVIGNEANGVSAGVADLCIPYRLPMRGRAESLNAATAASILIYKLTEV